MLTRRSSSCNSRISNACSRKKSEKDEDATVKTARLAETRTSREKRSGQGKKNPRTVNTIRTSMRATTILTSMTLSKESRVPELWPTTHLLKLQPLLENRKHRSRWRARIQHLSPFLPIGKRIPLGITIAIYQRVYLTKKIRSLAAHKKSTRPEK